MPTTINWLPILAQIDVRIRPETMTAVAALEALIHLRDDLQTRIDALKIEVMEDE